MVTVGVLAALINIAVLFVVAIADRAIELIVRNFATSRLITHRRAPVVHDSDTWLPFLPRSVIKYHRHPAILCTVLCTILLVTAELVSELGVDVSKTCKPVTVKGRVIAEGDITDSFTHIELSGTCFLLQSLEFDEGELTRVCAGIPRRLTGQECFKCIGEQNPDIISGCRVRYLKQFKAGDLEISINTTQGTFKTLTSSFKETSGRRTVYEGCGDLTYNGNKISTFLLYKHPDSGALWYFEYNHQQHLDVMKGVAPNYGGPVTQTTMGPVHLFEITCNKNALTSPNFAEVVRMYRTVQLENPINPAHLDTESNQFDPISTDAIYRAVLAAKIIDDVHDENGTFYRYTSCGKYNLSFLFPLGTCLTILVLLGAASHFCRADGFPSIQVPFNSHSWYDHARSLESMGAPQQEARKRKSGYFSNIFDELKIVEEGDDTLPQGRLVLQTRATRASNAPREHLEFVGAGNLHSSTIEAYQGQS